MFDSKVLIYMITFLCSFNTSPPESHPPLEIANCFVVDYPMHSGQKSISSRTKLEKFEFEKY